jgi:hypothetical protein
MSARLVNALDENMAANAAPRLFSLMVRNVLRSGAGPSACFDDMKSFPMLSRSGGARRSNELVAAAASASGDKREYQHSPRCAANILF